MQDIFIMQIWLHVLGGKVKQNKEDLRWKFSFLSLRRAAEIGIPGLVRHIPWH